MIALIAALSANGCIGIQGRLPWHLPEDLARFKALTLGKAVLMGRKTWESIPDRFRPLPQRTNVVISRSTGYDAPPGVSVFSSVDDALIALADQDVYVIGGAQIYAQTIDRSDRLILTRVDRIVTGDTFFPEISPQQWSEVLREPHEGFAFVTYERVRIDTASEVDNTHATAIS